MRPQFDPAQHSDGCSCWFDGWWRAACVDHDRAYYNGGDAAARCDADAILAADVVEHSVGTGSQWRILLGVAIAAAMFYTVRIGGHPMLPFPWRWNYGSDPGWRWAVRLPSRAYGD